MTNENEIVDEALNIVKNMDINEVYAVSGALATFVVGLGVTFNLPPGIDAITFGDSLAQVAILTLDKQRGKYSDLEEMAKKFFEENGRNAGPFNFID